MPKSRTRKRSPAAPARSVPRLSQAHAYYRKGDLENAAKLCRLITARQPNEPQGWHLLGAVILARGDPDAALRHFERAIALATPTADLLCAQGAALLQTGRAAAGETALRQAVELDDSQSQAYALLGQAMAAQGRYDDARANLVRATELAPSDAAHWTALGRFCLDTGDPASAFDAFNRAAAAEPTKWTHRVNLGAALQRLGRREEALDAYFAAWGQGARDHRLVFNLAGALRDFMFAGPQPEWVPVLNACLAAPGFDKQGLARPAMSLLAHDATFAKALGHAKRGENDDLVGMLADTSLTGNELFHRVAAATILNDPAFESLIGALRRAALSARLRDLPPGPPLTFLVALAHQFWNTEYLCDASDAEMHQHRELTGMVAERLLTLDIPDEALARDLSVLACYAPLTGLGEDIGRPAPDPEIWPTPFGDLVRRQIAEPDREKELAGLLPILGTVSDDTSRRVRDQYEANPYPRWQFANVENVKPLAVSLAEANPAFVLPDRFKSPGRTLIAGCGTGKQAIEAARNQPDWEIFAVDLSRPSLAYAWRQAEALGIGNLRFAVADILALERLESRFQLIGCTGVLHHMADPMTGWRVLTNLLEPGGLMRIGLYSRRARAAIAGVREYAKNHAVPKTRDGVRHLRREIRAGNLPSLGTLERGVDFYTVSGGRDLMLHEQEHQFSLPEIADMLKALGLKWIGLDPPGHPAVHARAGVAPADGNDLAAWDRLEQQHEDLFASMYVFWCQKPQ